MDSLRPQLRGQMMERIHSALPDEVFPVNAHFGVIHVHVSKTAGTSVRQALFGSQIVRHIKASAIDPVLWNLLPSFSIVRHPVERYLSNYRFHVLSEYDGVLFKKYPDLRSLSLAAYTERFLHSDLEMFAPQGDFLVRIDTLKTRVDHILHFETLERDWARLRAVTEVDVHLPKIKVSPPLREDVPAEVLAAVTERYASDFALLGYSH